MSNDGKVCAFIGICLMFAMNPILIGVLLAAWGVYALNSKLESEG